MDLGQQFQLSGFSAVCQLLEAEKISTMAYLPTSKNANGICEMLRNFKRSPLNSFTVYHSKFQGTSLLMIHWKVKNLLTTWPTESGHSCMAMLPWPPSFRRSPLIKETISFVRQPIRQSQNNSYNIFKEIKKMMRKTWSAWLTKKKRTWNNNLT